MEPRSLLCGNSWWSMLQELISENIFTAEGKLLKKAENRKCHRGSLHRISLNLMSLKKKKNQKKIQCCQDFPFKNLNWIPQLCNIQRSKRVREREMYRVCIVLKANKERKNKMGMGEKSSSNSSSVKQQTHVIWWLAPRVCESVYVLLCCGEEIFLLQLSYKTL